MERMMIAHIPHILRDVPDFQCLMGTYQDIFANFWRLERGLEDNFYLHTAEDAGLSHWERILGIVPRVGSSIEERRQIVMARMYQTTPYCFRTLLALLLALTGDPSAFSAELDELTLTVRLFPRFREMEGAVWAMLRQMVPANIALYLILVFRTHGALRPKTHRTLGRHTHHQLRSEVDLFE